MVPKPVWLIYTISFTFMRTSLGSLLQTITGAHNLRELFLVMCSNLAIESTWKKTFARKESQREFLKFQQSAGHLDAGRPSRSPKFNMEKVTYCTIVHSMGLSVSVCMGLSVSVSKTHIYILLTFCFITSHFLFRLMIHVI